MDPSVVPLSPSNRQNQCSAPDSSVCANDINRAFTKRTGFTPKEGRPKLSPSRTRRFGSNERTIPSRGRPSSKEQTSVSNDVSFGLASPRKKRRLDPQGHAGELGLEDFMIEQMFWSDQSRLSGDYDPPTQGIHNFPSVAKLPLSQHPSMSVLPRELRAEPSSYDHSTIFPIEQSLALSSNTTPCVFLFPLTLTTTPSLSLFTLQYIFYKRHPNFLGMRVK